MKRFFGWLFVCFAVISFLGSFIDADPIGGIVVTGFHGIIAYFLLKKGKMKIKIPPLSKLKSVKHEKADSAPENSANDLDELALEEFALEELGLEEVTEIDVPVQTIRFACKSCGAKNEERSSGNEIRCEYCGSVSIPELPSL